MLFNSLHFIVFFPIVVIFYFSLKQKYRWIFLLAASYYFYGCWSVKYLGLLAITTLIDYLAGVMMGRTPEKKKRRKYFIISIIGNLGLLFFFKYFNFFNENMNSLMGVFNIFYHLPELKIILPVGISFYTFQSLSYSIDVYKGRIKPEKHLGIYSLYVSFFPQLVAGPIERSRNLLPQFYEKHEFSYENLISGLKLMAWGFFKKIVVADRLGIFVNSTFNDPSAHFGADIWLASMFFVFQLYCDFSGYSDIAIGSARIMGFKLMKNFRRPFSARTFSEFWDKWHISLNTWFRDYLLFELPLSKTKKWIKFSVYRNLIFTVLIIGFWHGASWTFVIWGALIAFYLTTESLTRPFRKRFFGFIGLYRFPVFHQYFDMVSIFLLMALSPLIFRANSMSDFGIIISNIFTNGQFFSSFKVFTKDFIIFDLMLVVIFLLVEFLQEKHNIINYIGSKPLIVRWSVYLVFIFAILIFGVFHKDQFIYFQF